MSTEPGLIECRDAGFELNGQPIVSGLNFSIPRGEILVLLGRSGSGKTTTLKLINRLLDLTRGEIRFEDKRTADWDPIRLRRRIGYVIQEIGLFPHFSVERNVALVPRLEGWQRARIEARVRELLNLVGLDPAQFAKRYPHELSGGQRQRVGVARALAADPTALLMDEPFGALDPITRGEIQQEFRQLQRGLGKTVVLVTHDVQEALRVADRIGLMEAGRLVEIQKPRDFLQSGNPAVRAVLASLPDRREIP
ncbi:MAG TPA: ATP-binding cassette domain-containing protein [Acidobacteriota bacterium]|jgi:osmoprotectant transport system ATP-binding protein